MVNIAEKKPNKELFPIWNPEFVITKDKISGNNMLCFPIQNTKLLNFKHFKALSAFDVKLDFDKIDNWGLSKYCDGSNTVEQICKLVMSQYPEITEAAVVEKIEKMVRLNIITLK
jgi:hypothetical protein